jgi:transketolase
MKEWHQSQRGYFAGELFKQMEKNKDIWLITADLGYGMFDNIQSTFPDRFINTGAAEQTAIGISIGLAMEGKIPFVYSITPFLIYRPFEWIRNYLNAEKWPVKLVGSGRDKDYEIDGLTHDASGVEKVLDTLPNILQYWPKDKEEVPYLVEELIENRMPSFISLRR